MAVHGNTKKYKIYKMRKKWFRKTNGFYNNSNVIRIECELRGVGIVPLLRVWSFEGERRRLEPIQHYRDDEKIRKKPKVSSFDSKVIKKYF